MSTKFFNNGHGNTLFDKLKGIASEMTTFDRFLAVVGFFRSSGYFKLREELGDVPEIKILVGINIDDIFRKHNKALLMMADADKAKQVYDARIKALEGPSDAEAPIVLSGKHTYHTQLKQVLTQLQER